MATPRALIFSGFGLNCEYETQLAFELAGGQADIVHLNTLIANPSVLQRYQIAVFPGGFSYGDDVGSGKAYGRRVARHLRETLDAFIARDTLVLGICNGFQILTNTGLLPGALTANDSARYVCRWVDVAVNSASPWLAGLSQLPLPIAHGEGKYYDTAENLAALEAHGQLALTYTAGEMSRHFSLPANPNGSLQNIAGVTSIDGRVLGMMPHPERGMLFTQLPHWTTLRQEYRDKKMALPKYAAGLQIFRNAIKAF